MSSARKVIVAVDTTERPTSPAGAEAASTANDTPSSAAEAAPAVGAPAPLAALSASDRCTAGLELDSSLACVAHPAATARTATNPDITIHRIPRMGAPPSFGANHS
jgi:hypothetical protein